MIGIFFILVRANDADDTPTKCSLLCLRIIFPPRYHLCRFDGTRAIGAYEQSGLNIFSVKHELICNTQEVRPFACCLCAFLHSKQWSALGFLSSFLSRELSFTSSASVAKLPAPNDLLLLLPVNLPPLGDSSSLSPSSFVFNEGYRQFWIPTLRIRKRLRKVDRLLNVCASRSHH